MRAPDRAQLERARELAARLGLPDAVATRELLGCVVSGSSVACMESGTGRHTAALAALAVLPGPGLVIGPEVASLADLRDRLSRAGIAALLLNDVRGAEPDRGTLEEISSGRARIVLGTPRWFAEERVLGALRPVRVSAAVILAAHRISPRSPDFSPPLTRIPALLSRLGRPPVMAFMPRAREDVREDAGALLLMGGMKTLEGPRLPENVILDTEEVRRELRLRVIVERLRSAERPALVFCATSREVEDVHAALHAAHLPVHRYHEGLGAGIRAAEQLEFSMPGDEKILVATSAFAASMNAPEVDPEGVAQRYGQRVSKADIRTLFRLTPPTSVEALAGEISLVGRDGRPSRVTILHDRMDRAALEAEVFAARPTGEQFLLFSRAVEGLEGSSAVTTEELALSARTSLRSIETLASMLAQMGLVSHHGGWLRLLSPASAVLPEIRMLAERYALVRSLDARRLAEVLALVEGHACPLARLEELFGPQGRPAACGRCKVCLGRASGQTGADLTRRAPARRFTVTAPESSPGGDTFHTDRTSRTAAPLTAKMADFK